MNTFYEHHGGRHIIHFSASMFVELFDDTIHSNGEWTLKLEIAEWLDENMALDYICYKSQFDFGSVEDAMAFKLAWC